ncbi:geranylgeranylglyceryl/heptaprenylglyceryl phosphate synthase [Siphonobacter aquaeclarae]|uniref:Geranylgeranylglyceryl phosphate synthase n=1 Tax=Siphonobacter aquaeclarae TaxID=563176 RepID=A0A1G9ME22_9BACT|nr:geranylgeranylglyceryl/heptaprenylglyceryl phosphate synthase [Siphonobacter aquaeclarae]SDL72512.1 putative glycerol-1-phosphate prenyltransferase [Siphonobacter aquaeclarae]
MIKPILKQFETLREQGRKAFAVLIDPDDVRLDEFPLLLQRAEKEQVDYFFIGGSLITQFHMGDIIALIRQHTRIPVVLFLGSNMHVHPAADAVLFLSLISGRNPEYLIGQQVVAAPMLKKSGLEVLPTGYLLIDAGRQTTASYISNTTPIPNDKPAVAACTAMAGEMLGLRLTYLDAGSGALKAITPEMIAAVRQSVETPIIVGGGIDSAQKARTALEAGADVVVVGNGIERNPDLLPEIAATVRHYNAQYA